MTSSKSLPSVEEALEQLPSTVSTYRDADTKRRRFSVRGITSEPSRSNKTCLICGAAKAGRGTMCKACYMRVRAVKVSLTCAWCSKEFERPLYVHEKALKHGRQEAFCGNACLCASNNYKKAVAANRTCLHCGTLLVATRDRYCSAACKAAAAKKRKELEDRTCPWCGATFSPATSRRQYCSRTCANAAHSVRMRGKGNSHFKTGTSYAKWFAEMRPLVLDRDGHICIVCQKAEQIKVTAWKGQDVDRSNLVIHHINEDPTDNSPENLVTLCKTCHAVHHKSAQTPWPWLGVYAQAKSQSMTSKWKKITTSLQRTYSPTTA